MKPKDKNEYSTIVPWMDPEQLNKVYCCLYRGSLSEKRWAVDQISVWNTRCHPSLPTAIESSVTLVRAVIHDMLFEANKTFCQEEDVQLLYSMALIRFVNLTLEHHQKANNKISMSVLAAKNNIPEWVLDLRHEAVHSYCPSRSILRNGTEFALRYLENTFWSKVSKTAKPLINPPFKREEEVVILINRYKNVQFQKFEDKNFKREKFIDILVRPGNFTSAEDIMKLSSDKSVMAFVNADDALYVPLKLQTFWLQLLITIYNKELMPMFVVKLLLAHGKCRIKLCQKVAFAWALHIFLGKSTESEEKMNPDFSSFVFPKLDDSNYSPWKEDMKVLLMDRCCWNFAIGEEKPYPEEAIEKEKLEYEWRKQRCYTTIYQGVERKLLPLIRHTTDGKEAWNILKDNFEPVSKARLAVLIDEFFELRFNPEQEQIGIFCKCVSEKENQVKDAGFEIPDLLVALQLIRRLSAEYDHLVQILYRMKDAEFTHLEVERQLINESGRIQLKKKDLNTTENAYNVGSPPGKEMSKKSVERSGNVLDPTRSPGQYKKNLKGVGPWLSKDLEQFLVDSASTSHFCCERDWFKNFRELSPIKALLADKRHTCEVKGVGDIDFCIKDVKGDVHITLKDVLYAPNMRRNLISGAKMDFAGLKINLCNNVMRVYHSNNEYFFSVFRQEMLHIVYGYPLIENVMHTSVDLNVIHRRLCHVNVPMIKDMSKNHSVKGLEPVNVKTKYEPCIACNLGKATRTSLKNVVYKRVTKSVLEKVHMDLWGPAPVNSLGGNNGMEFCHKELEKFLRELGIKSERTTIFTPELNGVSERFNRSSMDAVRTLLQDSGLQPRFWAEALQNYVYTKNRCIHKLTEGKTLIEIWSGRKPSIKHCRIFGSLAYVYVPKAYRNKLQPKAKIGIFMGYAISRRGYRVRLPKEGKIEESIHVKIDETKNGVQTLFGKIKRYDYAWYQLDQTLKDGSYTKLQDDKTCLPENLLLLDISTWERLEKPRKEKQEVFDPDQFNFKPTVNKRFDQKSNSEEETSIDSNSLDEGNCIDDIFQHEIYMSEIPKTYAETRNSSDKSKWDEAMSEEIEMMQSRKVWDLVEPNSNRKVLGCRWVYDIKQDEKNNVRKYKSRLVAQGFKQRPGVDFTDVFAPLVNFDVIKFLFVLLVCILGWNHAQIDVKAAYLYGKLDTPVYMQQPEGFVAILFRRLRKQVVYVDVPSLVYACVKSATPYSGDLLRMIATYTGNSEKYKKLFFILSLYQGHYISKENSSVKRKIDIDKDFFFTVEHAEEELNELRAKKMKDETDESIWFPQPVSSESSISFIGAVINPVITGINADKQSSDDTLKEQIKIEPSADDNFIIINKNDGEETTGEDTHDKKAGSETTRPENFDMVYRRRPD
ncbi:Retrovirus-related Pol polyprotein like [Argiope bruennichi]|uniref:Retrovirus-related Pol polyprotein like n=1 Tax=Argiope bruennichi TaxID=94029 RepID=A0A8T0FXC7_ARGBR|nr:Retrovirus-related Pol polyprotein like [Argiope bruennichi]